MPSLVLDLQRAALDSKTSVADLLRMALVVAKKLALRDFEKWIQSELKGYSDPKEIPQYRILSGQPVTFDPLRGWQLLFTHNMDPERVRKMRTFHLPYPVGEIEADVRGDEAAFHLFYEERAEKFLMEQMSFPAKPAVRFERSQFQGVLDAMRNIILEWSLKLEGDGILGEGMSFNESEKRIASSASHNITNYIHQVIDSQVQVGATHSVMNVSLRPLDLDAVRDVVHMITNGIGQPGLDERQRSELGADINTIEAQMRSPKPKESIIREGLRSIRNILEGAVGSGLAAAVLPHIKNLLSQ